MPKPRLLVTAALALSLAACQKPGAPAEPAPGSIAATHLEYLSGEIGTRVAGSAAELQAAAYTFSQFQALGLSPKMLPFEYTRKAKDGTSTRVRSQNVTALLKGDSPREIVVTAHMDTVAKGRGADDNASSVGTILEVAQRLRNAKLPYSVRFLITGAEEEGLRGSLAYVAAMSEAELENTQLVINLDSLLAGDFMYVYGEGAQGTASRDEALKWADSRGLSLITQSGLNPEYPAGTTGDWSDHAPFKARGVSYAYLEATNWNLGDKDGYTQTEKAGAVWHTDKDSLEFLRREFPGRVEERLATFNRVLRHMLEAPPTPLGPASVGDSARLRPVPLNPGDFERRHHHDH